MAQSSFSFFAERRIYSVSEINAAIRETLESDFADVWVEGEISNFRPAPSGHLYFTLKDAQAQLKSVFFRQDARLLRFKPADGMAVLARGRVSVYEVRGEYQLYVELLEPLGAGALQLAFEQLKKKLAAEGLFDPGRKKPLPLFPRRIGLVTSPRGAVIADMLRILGRRFPGLHIRLYPVPVQGEGAAGKICEALNYFSDSGWSDLLIVGRGGGSLEDLWPFNEESVARAIAACPVPVISAVGHETDFTIADFVADLRAPTPSAAAELAIRSKSEFVELITGWYERLCQALRYQVAVLHRRLTDLGVERVAGSLRRRLNGAGQRTDELDYRLREQVRRRLLETERRLGAAAARLQAQDLRVQLASRRVQIEQLRAAFEPLLQLRLARLRGRLDSLHAQLGHLSPLGVLERGYAIVQDESGRVLRRAAETAPGRGLRVRLHEGRLRAEVWEIESGQEVE
ncbi:MAG: exodeoxyribonuclease VII large subunit [Acidobacteria bacterium]|nr:exodeoxyribonuclease VII large subunit [Acidobacteriota bacterium]